MRRAVPVLAVALTAACGTAGPPDANAPREDALVSGYGITVSPPPGWKVRITRGRVEAATFAFPDGGFPGGRYEMRADDVVVLLRENGGTDEPFAHVEPPIVLAESDVAAPGSDQASALPAGRAVASKPVEVAGRSFVVWAELGSRARARELVEAANELLARTEVTPGDFMPGFVDPARFVEAPGWHTGSSGPGERHPDGEQTQSWAATIPYRNGPYDLPPRETISALGPDDVLVWVGLSRYSEPSGAFEPKPPPFRLVDFDRHDAWEGQVRDLPLYVLLARTPDYDVELHLYFGRAVASPAMRAAADAALARLVLPEWPPWEAESRSQ